MDPQRILTKLKRIAIGLLTSVRILLLLDLIPNPVPDQYAVFQLTDQFYVWPGAGGLIGMFVAAFGGAYVSKVPKESLIDPMPMATAT